MVEFSWIPIEMVEIGTMYMPFCEADIQSKNGQWITFSFKVDSGADMTLMEVDNCYSLGFDLDGCKQIDSTSSRDTKFPTFIRKLKMKIGDQILDDVPVAFSTKPIKTLLLGRFKIFEQFEICFDGVNKRTILRHL
jgi:hypothetical protein